eukprot:CAMPEP_0168762678 /NCGR_PEP_ID=MMETSP0724-20121128/23967_1 /TAXON_ID=265536 /ORGANISM="Amphiprora sp., Strain CCMP467" /LENGTH=532 /DNA_ID=CAMNT_0008811849 /DNA_START=195 /DNA_END=1793 /DNA_ORIENTATION=-
MALPLTVASSATTTTTPTRKRSWQQDAGATVQPSSNDNIGRKRFATLVTPEPVAVGSSSSSVRRTPRASPTALFATSTAESLKEEEDAHARQYQEEDSVPIDGSANHHGFRDLKVPPHELRPSATLTTGQCFHWKDVTRTTTTLNDTDNESDDNKNRKSSAWGTHNAQEWIGTLRQSQSGDAVVVRLRETPTTTLYQVLHHYHHGANSKDKNNKDIQDLQFYDEMLRSYFQLDDHPLQPLYEEWSQQCPRMAEIAKSIPGVRIIRQDPWECLISFICSSNNNIPRITSMLQSIRQTYGDRITDDDESNHDNDDGVYYSFPSPEQLSRATEQELRDVCGLGYRAKYIVKTTRHVLDEWGGESALMDLRTATAATTSAASTSNAMEEEDASLQRYWHVREKLLELAGVGPKVADCVAMFSLDQDAHAIPVDVHVWNIAKRDYSNEDDNAEDPLFSGQKSVTPKLYQRVQQVFRQKFPNKTAWAHSLLFVAELPSFRPTLPPQILKEMDEFKKREQEEKKQQKGQAKKNTTKKSE